MVVFWAHPTGRTPNQEHAEEIIYLRTKNASGSPRTPGLELLLWRGMSRFAYPAAAATTQAQINSKVFMITLLVLIQCVETSAIPIASSIILRHAQGLSNLCNCSTPCIHSVAIVIFTKYCSFILTYRDIRTSM